MNDDNKILYAYSFELDYTKTYCWVLNRLCKLNVDNMVGIYEYLVENKFTNIVIWGINELSMIIGNELIKHSNIEKLVIYDNIKNIKNFKLNSFEFDTEIYWIDSIDDILKDKTVDIFIIVDLSVKNWFETKNKYLKLNIEFIDSLVMKIIDFSITKYIDSTMYKLNKNGIHTFCVSVPSLDSIHNLRDYTKSCIETIQKKGRTKDNISYIYNKFDKSYISEFLDCFFNRQHSIKKKDILYSPDYRSKYINCICGRRFIINQPEVYDNTVYILGSCIADSYFTEDRYTVGSYLQNLLLTSDFSSIYRVVAIYGGGSIYWKHTLNWINYLELKKGDIVVLLDREPYMPLSSINLTKQFNDLYQKEDFFLDIPVHCNHKGYKIIAEEIFKYLNKNNFNKIKSKTCNKEIRSDNKIDVKKTFQSNTDLIEYLEYIKKLKINGSNIIGSIVMNCNPFTLGHRYLIETAIKEVDWLYVFIVEEDKSTFSFKNRFELANINTKDLNNITIIPSGKFIASAATFPGYFTKDTLPTVNIDTSTDVEIFGQYIVPALNINIRFVGNEPYDIVTNQYNRSLKEILPKYNVEVKIIERKEIDGDIVSAAKVRDLLKNNKLYETKKFLSNATFEYIKKLYESNPNSLIMK